MDYKKRAYELSRSYARQYKHNNCDLTEDKTFVFSNEEINDACRELGREMYWKAREAFCKTTCKCDVCPLFTGDIEGVGSVVVDCDKLETFVETFNRI